MPRAALSAPELAAAIDLARAATDGHQIEFWLGPERGVLDETTIDLAWLPGAGWSDMTATVLLSDGALINHDGVGPTITFTVVDESRSTWRDDLAVAVIASHFYPATASWGTRALVAWAYLSGEDRQTLDMDYMQTGQRVATYTGYWEKKAVDALRMGRRNLASSASIHASTAILAVPAEESPLEYVSQDNCAATKILDGYVDTVSVLDVFADPVTPTIGDSTTVKFLRFYGPQLPGIAVGGIPRFVELWIGHNVTPWGTTWTGIPGMYFEGTAAERTEAGRLFTQAVTYGDGTRGFQVTSRQSADPAFSTWIQWIVSATPKVPMRVRIEIKAGSPFSIGKRVHLMLSDATTEHTQRFDVRPLALGLDWQRFEFVYNSDEHAGGAKIEITTEQGETFGGDVIYELRNLEVATGYSDEAQAPGNAQRRLFLCYDNGSGVQGCQRIAFDLVGGAPDWTIPAFGSVIITDDIPTFKQMFGDTGKTLMQMKNLNPLWYWAPNTGKMKLAYATNPVRTNYNDPSLVLVEEVDFSTNGFAWAANTALIRGSGTVGSPLGTGAWTTENFPHVGLLPSGGLEVGYWWVDLGAYQAPKLKLPMTTASTRATVDNIDAYTESGFLKIGTERMQWTGKDGDTLLISARPITGTTLAAHSIGDSVIPDGFTGVFQNSGASQTGWNVDQIKLRRKAWTPVIRSGVIIYSNQVSPSDPTTGGLRWERNPDWNILQRFSDRQGNLDVVTLNLAELVGGPKEMRHIVFGIVQMDRDPAGNPQRAKLNEMVILEAELAAQIGGNFRSKNASDLAGALGYLLTQKAGMPAAKVAIAQQANGTAIQTPAIGDLPIAPTDANAAINSIAAKGLLRVWLDAANKATIDAMPTNPAYTPTVPYFTVDSSMLTAPFTLNWAGAHAVSQVKITARLVAGLRVYSAVYPSIPAVLGKVVELRDVSIFDESGVVAIAEATYRDRNTRRRAAAPLGALPWLEIGQRILVNLPEIDLGGNGIGVTFVVASFSIQVGMDDGGVTWDTSVTLVELGL